MFVFNEEEHAVKARNIRTISGEFQNVTRSALASLRIGIKAYFETYYTVIKKSIDFSLSPSDPFYDFEQESIRNLCDDLEYQEKYMQCVFHFHHFFELFLKDFLKSKHEYLALKISLDSKNAQELLNIINNNVSPEDLIHENTVEFDLALNRVISLRDTDTVAELIYEFRDTLKTLNMLRNRAWHRGLLILRITALDNFFSKNVFPLVIEVFKANSSYKDTERFWKYRAAEMDPIEKIIEYSTENYKALMFFKAYGLACYNNPGIKWNLEIHETIDKAKAIVNTLQNLELKNCLVCGGETMIVSSEHAVDIDSEGTPTAAWWNTTAAECLNCKFSIFPDVGEPKDYGVGNQILWDMGRKDFD